MPSQLSSNVITRKHTQLVVSLQVALLMLSCFLPFSVEAKSAPQKKKHTEQKRARQLPTSKPAKTAFHPSKSQALVAATIGRSANKLFSNDVPNIKVALEPDWDIVAADLLKYCQPLSACSQSLREMIDSATHNSAYVAQAPAAPKAPEMPISKTLPSPELVKVSVPPETIEAGKVKAPEIEKTPAPSVVFVPATTPTAVPQIIKQEFKESYTEPAPLAVDRLDTVEKLDAKAIAKDERRNRARKRIAMKDDTNSGTSMRIVPPMPAIKMKNKENPFIDANINFTRPLMLGVPH